MKLIIQIPSYNEEDQLSLTLEVLFTIQFVFLLFQVPENEFFPLDAGTGGKFVFVDATNDEVEDRHILVVCYLCSFRRCSCTGGL